MGEATTWCNNAGHPHNTYSEAQACDLEAHRRHVEELQRENQEGQK